VGDWYETDASIIADRLVKLVHPGAIVLFHETLFDQVRTQPGRGPKHYINGWYDGQAVFAAMEMMFQRMAIGFDLSPFRSCSNKDRHTANSG
jgi:hypothetical protein